MNRCGCLGLDLQQWALQSFFCLVYEGYSWVALVCRFFFVRLSYAPYVVSCRSTHETRSSLLVTDSSGQIISRSFWLHVNFAGFFSFLVHTAPFFAHGTIRMIALWYGWSVHCFIGWLWWHVECDENIFSRIFIKLCGLRSRCSKIGIEPERKVLKKYISSLVCYLTTHDSHDLSTAEKREFRFLAYFFTVWNVFRGQYWTLKWNKG